MENQKKAQYEVQSVISNKQHFEHEAKRSALAAPSSGKKAGNSQQNEENVTDGTSNPSNSTQVSNGTSQSEQEAVEI